MTTIIRWRQLVPSMRRERQWTIIQSNFTMSGALVAIDLTTVLEASLGSTLHNVTVSALRLTIDMNFAAGLTVGDRSLNYFGVMWISREALAVGSAALANPATDAADWMMHGTRLIVSESALLHKPRGASMEFFSDSQRKQRENNSVLVLIGTAPISDHGVQVFIGGRALFILP